MLFRHNRPEYSDGFIDLIPIHIGAPNRELGFGHEQVWKITLHDEHRSAVSRAAFCISCLQAD